MEAATPTSAVMGTSAATGCVAVVAKTPVQLPLLSLCTQCSCRDRLLNVALRCGKPIPSCGQAYTLSTPQHHSHDYFRVAGAPSALPRFGPYAASYRRTLAYPGTPNNLSGWSMPAPALSESDLSSFPAMHDVLSSKACARHFSGKSKAQPKMAMVPKDLPLFARTSVSKEKQISEALKKNQVPKETPMIHVASIRWRAAMRIVLDFIAVKRRNSHQMQALTLQQVGSNLSAEGCKFRNFKQELAAAEFLLALKRLILKPASRRTYEDAEDIDALLIRISWFAALAKDLRQRLSDSLRYESQPQGAVLLKAHRPGSIWFTLLAGLCEEVAEPPIRQDRTAFLLPSISKGTKNSNLRDGKVTASPNITLSLHKHPLKYRNPPIVIGAPASLGAFSNISDSPSEPRTTSILCLSRCDLISIDRYHFIRALKEINMGSYIILRFLRRFRSFSYLSRYRLYQISLCGRIRRYKSGTVIHDNARTRERDNVFFVVSGEVIAKPKAGSAITLSANVSFPQLWNSGRSPFTEEFDFRKTLKESTIPNAHSFEAGPSGCDVLVFKVPKLTCKKFVIIAMFFAQVSRIAARHSVRNVVQRRGVVTIKKLYTAEATADASGRGGAVKSTEGFATKLAYPKALGGPGNDATNANPEILFAAGYSACFMGALNAVAGKMGVKIPSTSTVTSKVSIGPPVGGVGFGLAVDLDVALPGLEKDIANKVLAAAHELCPYSNATRNNIEVNVKLI
ncbi:hypothetical protein HDU67_006967 [Dinochytrium kinnereticum]|nr:hypothetical protein HDU67_006967 [Dinochytrium kinnereticum]